MTVEQLALDLWAAVPPAAPDPHQRGHVRLPYDTGGLGKTGDLAEAWICCRCGRPELSRFLLELDHSCCNPNRVPHCGRPYPYDLSPHWIPPSTEDHA